MTNSIDTIVGSGDNALVSGTDNVMEVLRCRLTLHSMKTWKLQTQAALIPI